MVDESATRHPLCTPSAPTPPLNAMSHRATAPHVSRRHRARCGATFLRVKVKTLPRALKLLFFLCLLFSHSGEDLLERHVQLIMQDGRQWNGVLHYNREDSPLLLGCSIPGVAAFAAEQPQPPSPTRARRVVGVVRTGRVSGGGGGGGGGGSPTHQLVFGRAGVAGGGGGGAGVPRGGAAAKAAAAAAAAAEAARLQRHKSAKREHALVRWALTLCSRLACPSPFASL